MEVGKYKQGLALPPAYPYRTLNGTPNPVLTQLSSIHTVQQPLNRPETSQERL